MNTSTLWNNSAFVVRDSDIIKNLSVNSYLQAYLPNKVSSSSSDSPIYAINAIAFSTPKSSVKTDARNESFIIASLPSAQKRWSFIAKHHPAEFLVSITSLILASSAIIHAAWPILIKFASFFVSEAFAQTKNEASIGLFGSSWFSMQSFVAILLAIAMFWLFGILSWAKNEAKITFAREGIKQLFGFFTGLMTGSLAK